MYQREEGKVNSLASLLVFDITIIVAHPRWGGATSEISVVHRTIEINGSRMLIQ